MRTTSDLIALAVHVAEDAAARFVLADALEETGWWDERMEERWEDGPDFGPVTFHRGDEVTPQLARAMAAVLLFGDWTAADETTNPPVLVWPVAAACRRPPTAVELQMQRKMASLPVDAMLERCEKVLAKLRYPAEVELVTLRDGVVRVHAHADIPAHAVAIAEREMDAWLPFSAVFEIRARAKRPRK